MQRHKLHSLLCPQETELNRSLGVDVSRKNKWMIASIWLKENSSHCKMVAEQFAAAAAAMKT